MTTFAELYDKVVSITSRPELMTTTKLAIAKATVEAHHIDFFPRDRKLAYVPYTVNSAVPICTIANIYATYPRLRGIQSIRGVDTNGRAVEQLAQCDYDNFYDSDNALKYSVYDAIGTSILFTPQVQTGRLEMVAYENPDPTESTYASWIADMYPEFLAYWAAMHVQARSGAVELAQISMKLHVEPFKELLIESHLLSEVN
jgi:hypothetical protein